MKIGLIGAMEEEIRSLTSRLADKIEHPIANVTFIQGRVSNHEVVLVQSGIGKVNATLVTTLLIQHFQVELVINTGTAGGLHPNLEVGDVVIADSLSYHDVDVTGFGHALGQMAGMPQMYYPTLEFNTIVKQSFEEMRIRPIMGLLVSGDQFINDSKKIERIKDQFPQALACEMESTAIAQTCYVLDTPFIIIRAISDKANEVANISFDEFVVFAGQQSANMIVKFIENLD